MDLKWNKSVEQSLGQSSKQRNRVRRVEAGIHVFLAATQNAGYSYFNLI
jgi:hypothetical protein